MKFFISVVFILIMKTVSAQEASLYFNFNSHILRSNDVIKLKELIYLNRNSNIKFKIQGYTDSSGTANYNMELSRKRAEFVRQFLIQNEVDENRIQANYFGEAFVDKENSSYNRRVDLFIEQDQKQEILSYDQLLESLKPEKQIFSFNNSGSFSIEGMKGTMIKVPESAFQTSDGLPVKGDIRIELEEYYSMSDFLSQKLTTISDGNLLASSGMVNVKAFKDTGEIYLRTGKSIELSFPKTSDKRFYTFYGERQENETMNWKLDEELWKKKQEDIGAYMTGSGKMVITDKTTANIMNKDIMFDSKSKEFRTVSPTEKKEFEIFLSEQRQSDSIRTQLYNIIESKQLKWINCDYFINDPSSTIIEYFVRSSNPEIEIQNAWLVFKKLNSVVSLNIQNDRRTINARLPLNQPVQLLVTGFSNGKPFSYLNSVELKNKKTEIVTLKETTLSAMQSLMKQL